MIIDLGRVTKETKVCSLTAITHDVGSTWKFFVKRVNNVDYFCKTQPAGYLDLGTCPSSTLQIDCTK